jgi:hypothetical protein
VQEDPLAEGDKVSAFKYEKCAEEAAKLCGGAYDVQLGRLMCVACVASIVAEEVEKALKRAFKQAKKTKKKGAK